MKALAALHSPVGHEPGVPPTLLENFGLCYDHILIEGSLAFNCPDCHEHSVRGSKDPYQRDLP